MRKVIAVVAVIILALLYSSVFVVQQYERGIILRFAKVVRDAENKPVVYEPGLHFKIPFIENVKKLDARIQTMNIQQAVS